MRHRTRARYTDVLPRLSHHIVQTYPPPKEHLSNSSTSVFQAGLCRYGGLSDIRDELDASRNGKYVETHSCNHSIDRLEVSKDTTILAFGASSNPQVAHSFSGNLPSYAEYLIGSSHSSVENLNDFVGALGTVGTSQDIPVTDWEALRSQFLESSSSILRAELLLGETVSQPQIFLDALRFLVSPGRGIGRLVKYVAKRYGTNLRKLNMGQLSRILLRDAANSTLLYNFGIKPAVDDVIGISRSHNVVQKRLRYLRSNVDRFVPVRVRQSASTSVDTSSYHPTNVTIYRTSDYCDLTATMGCWARVRKDLTLEANLNGYFQYFGIGNILGLAWELVPYSFVVDWFTNVQERINLLNRSTYNPFGESRNFCASEKVQTYQSIRLSSGYLPSMSAFVPDDLSGLEIGKLISSRYSRHLTFPESSSLFDLSDLNFFHLITGGSLLLQKLLKNR